MVRGGAFDGAAIILIIIMAGSVTMDQINMQDEFNLKNLYEGETDDDELDSPYALVENVCNYHEPTEIGQMLSDNHDALSIFCLNSQGLRAHWDTFCNLLHDMT